MNDERNMTDQLNASRLEHDVRQRLAIARGNPVAFKDENSLQARARQLDVNTFDLNGYARALEWVLRTILETTTI